MTPEEEQAEIERLSKACGEMELEIAGLELDRQRLLAQIEEYKKIFYGERGPATVQQIEAQAKQVRRELG